MKKALLLLCLFGSSSVYAIAPADLAKEKNCFACHTLDKKLIGPSYKEVAAKYKGDAGAVSKLADKIKKGGSGVWGTMPMPPNAVSDAEAKDLAKWVLSTK
ncbi:c-type cytochrome [Iodobacter ciconiae]|uniref:C-type cytochrome n=1 Tax=Iodobacter ciconiae TaxID=2496266 RepID=A0A3S8ZQ20_9NEIS|nr:c-type cytochrome [Iodobacter ciconiae]AZN35581.1 c-type cytochrome [Iodobacter ciconiae]